MKSKKVRIISIVFFLILFLTACKISFKNEDLTVYNIYKINDTLVFKNEFGQTKKFAIISKNIIKKVGMKIQDCIILK